MPKPFDPAAFIAKHEAEVCRLREQLSGCVHIHTQRVINLAFDRMGERRFVGPDDRWEQIVAHLNGWEYTRPPQHLIARWRNA